MKEKRPTQIGPKDVKNQKTLSDYVKRLIWIEKQRSNN